MKALARAFSKSTKSFSDTQKVIKLAGGFRPTEKTISLKCDKGEISLDSTTGMSPLHFNLFSTVACKNVIFNNICNKQKVEVNNIDYEIIGDIDFRGLLVGDQISHWDKVTIKMLIETDSDIEKIEEIMEKVETQCPVESLLVYAGVPIETIIELVPLGEFEL